MVARSKKGTDIAVQCWRLDTPKRTLVLASFDNGCPALVHFGAKLPGNENLEALARLTTPNVAGGQLDPVVPLTLLPTAMDGWQGHPGIKTDAVIAPKLLAHSSDNQSLSFEIQCGAAHINCEIKLNENCCAIELSCDKTHNIDWLAASIPVLDNLPRIIDHGGRWCGEFQKQERRFTLGQHARESREGRSGHPHFPGMIFAADNCDENSGACMAIALEWSGGHKILAEEIADGRRHVQAGHLACSADYSQTIVLAWSDEGFNRLSQQLQNHVIENLPRKVARPVHYNCWEAVYFRHSVDELKEIATKASELGAERFVLDDGWFKGRNDDTTSLGDWVVDKDKYPDGLQPLVDHIHAQGMEFGIWFEPEMVNTDSDLYRAHPDWVLGPEDQPSGRGQFVLDLSKDGVTDYLFDAISAILKEYPATYIKWDHNRILTGGSQAQTIALYGLLERLNKAFPHVEIESCASGGGRVDYGILKHTTRVWLSDSNDALERLRMQHEASRWLPPQVQGSHVGPRQCHTSGRILPMAFRAWVAAQRHMGFEMDLRELTDDEAATLKMATAWYKQNRDFMFAAHHYRLDSMDDEIFAEMFVAKDQAQFITFVGQAGAPKQIGQRHLKLAGLEAEALYKLKLVDGTQVPPVLNQNSSIDFRQDSITLSGAALMAGALRPPNLFPTSMLVYEGRKVTHS